MGDPNISRGGLHGGETSKGDVRLYLYATAVVGAAVATGVASALGSTAAATGAAAGAPSTAGWAPASVLVGQSREMWPAWAHL